MTYGFMGCFQDTLVNIQRIPKEGDHGNDLNKSLIALRKTLVINFRQDIQDGRNMTYGFMRCFQDTLVSIQRILKEDDFRNNLNKFFIVFKKYFRDTYSFIKYP